MRCWLALGVGAFLVLGTGCATTNHERQVLLERVTTEVVYNMPPKQVMDAARAVLDERGYLPAPGGSLNSVYTQWKIDGDLDHLARWSKVLVIGEQRSDGRYVVRAQQVTWVTPGRADSHPGLEWAILQHLEPRFASQVEKQVDIYLASNHR